MSRNDILFAVIALWNLIVFALYRTDKQKAMKGDRRISEKALLASAALLGGIGALCGMFICRHKTKHSNFLAIVPTAAILTFYVMLRLIQS